jgi:MSHA biogenesis protein MshP
MRRRAVGPQRGFAMVAVAFVLVALAALVAGLAQLRERSGHAVVLETRQARALQAARAALQWAAWKVGDPQGAGTPGFAALPPCFASPSTLALPDSLAEFSVTVTCARSPLDTDPQPFVLEDERRLAMYTLVAVAAFGDPGTPDRVERRMELRLEACKDAASPAANFAC